MSTRNLKKNSRGTRCKRQTPVMLVVAEGKNKTESNYFKGFNHQGARYNVHTVSTGDTDPSNMMKSLNKAWEDNDLDEDLGDVAFVALDLDCSEERLAQILTVSSLPENKGKFIISNPCFELWFLLHFEYSTRCYLSSEELIRKYLRKYIPQYRKSDSLNAMLANKLEVALDRARKLQDYEQRIGRDRITIDSNPHTDILEIMNLLITSMDN